MATSGSTDYTQTRDQLILDAFQLLGVYGIGRTISSEDNNFAVSMLNKMIKSWQTKGLHLYTKERGVLYITPNVSDYSLGNSSTDAYVTKEDDETMSQVNGALAASATVVTLDDSTGMTAADNIGIVLTDKTIHWTTIVSVDSSTQVTITTGLASACSDNAYIYTFTNRLNKPLRVLSAQRVTGIDLGSTSTRQDIPLASVSHEEHFNLPTKTAGSIVNQFNYTPERLVGIMRLWPRPIDGSERVHFTYERIVEDLDNASDNFDFPSEWLECLTYNLAVRLAPAFGKDMKVMKGAVGLMAISLLEDLLAWDNEITSVFIQPGREY